MLNKDHRRSGQVILALATLVVLAAMVGASSAQGPQGPWLRIESSVSPEQAPIGGKLLNTLTLWNEGTAPATVDAVTTRLPAGVVYVGQAFGSDVASAAEIGQAQLRWTGPFTVPAGAALQIRYWAVVTDRARTGQQPLQAAALRGEQTVGSAESDLNLLAETVREVPDSQPSGVEMAPALPSAIQIGKVADVNPVKRGGGLAYTVTFTNTGSSNVTLSKIVDVLPSPFEYVGLGVYSEIDEEPDQDTAPNIIWDEWDGSPPVVPANGGTLVLHYVVWVPSETPTEPTYTNTVTAYQGTTPIASTSEDVKIEIYKVYMPLLFHNYTFPYFTAAKTAAPTTLTQGDLPEDRVVTYTVVVANEGDDPGVLDTIEDTLPNGFSFLGMASALPPGLSAPTTGATGKIVWTGPVEVDGHDELTLVYRTQAPDAVGTYVNSATATTRVGLAPQTPAQATVTVKPRIMFQDNFENGIGAWTPYLNLGRLREGQWFWDQWGGYDGSAGYTNWGILGWEPPLEDDDGAHDSLTMYLGEGSDQWTDYRFQAKFKMDKGLQVALWFRGTYQESTIKGQWVTGYYFLVRVRGSGYADTTKLMQLRTTEEHGDETNPNAWYHFTNPMDLVVTEVKPGAEPGRWSTLKVEVEGNRIKCYLNDVLAIDYTDTTGSIFLTGTVGFFTYGKYPNEALVHFDDVLVEPLD